MSPYWLLLIVPVTAGVSFVLFALLRMASNDPPHSIADLEKENVQLRRALCAKSMEARSRSAQAYLETAKEAGAEARARKAAMDWARKGLQTGLSLPPNSKHDRALMRQIMMGLGQCAVECKRRDLRDYDVFALDAIRSEQSELEAQRRLAQSEADKAKNGRTPSES